MVFAESCNRTVVWGLLTIEKIDKSKVELTSLLDLSRGIDVLGIGIYHYFEQSLR